MTPNLSKLSTHDLDTLASVLRSGRLVPPFSEPAIARIVHSSLVPLITEDLVGLTDSGFDGKQIAILLDALKNARQTSKRPDEIVDLVTTGPEAPGITNRDTSVVVRELFAKAQKSVLVVGYAVYQGAQVFQALAERMEAVESLDVKFFLNIHRPDRDQSEVSILVRKYMNRLRDHQWPQGCRLPDVYYDPRSLLLDKRSSLHAKCVVIDQEVVFVSSANFTNAGQERNVEVGLLVRSPIVAQQLTQHFVMLMDTGLMEKASR
ncbi:DISARM system phospholipase D-like protein DrmC [Planctomycetota bacterium]